MAPGSDQYQVTIIKYGTRSTTKADVFLNYALYHEADAPIQMDYFVWIVRNAARTVVVDTGFSRHGGDARGRTHLVDVRGAFGDFGVEPASAPDVLVTHAHYDHIGNLDHFARSRVYLARREREFWRSRHAARALFHHSVEDAELAHLDQVDREGRLALFDERTTIAPGIEAIVVGGHTPGQCVVKVDTSDGVVLLASDAVHYFEEYERDRLFTSVADLVEMYAGFDTIRSMIDAGEVDHLVPGHDPDTLSRFTPVTGRYAGLAATIGAAA